MSDGRKSTSTVYNSVLGAASVKVAPERELWKVNVMETPYEIKKFCELSRDVK